MTTFETVLLLILAAQAVATLIVARNVTELRKEVEGVWRRMPPPQRVEE